MYIDKPWYENVLFSYFSCIGVLFFSISSGRQQFGRSERKRSALLQWRSRSLTLRRWLTITCVQGIRYLPIKNYITILQSNALHSTNQTKTLHIKCTKTLWLDNASTFGHTCMYSFINQIRKWILQFNQRKEKHTGNSTYWLMLKIKSPCNLKITWRQVETWHLHNLDLLGF